MMTYLLNRKVDIIVRTPFGNTQSFEICNLVKQGTVLGLILNNCSLDDICSEGLGHNMGVAEIKTMEFHGSHRCLGSNSHSKTKHKFKKVDN